MVVLEQADYERLTDQVVDAYFKGTPLNDGILKVATELGLGPHQVKQLVWATNTKTHLTLFEKKAEDKNVEFPVADADYVMRRLLSPPEAQPLPVAKTASAVTLDFFSEVEAPVIKVAQEIETSLEDRPVSAKTAQARKDKMLRTMRKAASELEQNIYMEREGYADAIHKLAWELRKSGGRDDFEKDAFALYGDEVLDTLNDVRAVYKHEVTSAEKLASAVDRLVDDKTAQFKLLKTAREHFKEAIKYAGALKWLRAQLGDML